MADQEWRGPANNRGDIGTSDLVKYYRIQDAQNIGVTLTSRVLK